MVTFVATVPNNNYFAIGFGTSMRNTDMILWQAIGEKSVTTDLWSTGHGRPATDSNQNLDSSFMVSPDGKTVKFTTKRFLNTNDSQDFVIPTNQDVDMIYAYSRPGQSDFRKHAGYDWWKFNLNSANSISQDVSRP